MRIIILSVLVLSLLGGIPVTAQENIHPSQFLPAETWFYLEMNQAAPYLEWFSLSGDQLSLAVLPAAGDESLPTAFLILSADPNTDQWIANQSETGNWRFEAEDDWRAWYRSDTLFAYGYLRLGEWLFIGEERGLKSLIHQLESPRKLADESLFKASRSDTGLWAYSALNQTSLRFFADETGLGLDIRQQGQPKPASAAFDPQVLNAVPIGAWFVSTGMNADLPLQGLLTRVEELVAFLGGLNEDLSDLPIQLDVLVRTAAGVDLERDILPMFSGGYAFYLEQNPSLPINGGLVLSPPSTEGIFFSLTRLSNRLGQNLNITPEVSAPSQFTLNFPLEGLPSLVYGVSDNQYIYATSAEGSHSLEAAITGGANLNASSQWNRVLENAPVGTQQITYLNLRELGNSLNVWLAQNTDFDLADWQLFESLAIYHQADAEGLAQTRFWLSYEGD